MKDRKMLSALLFILVGFVLLIEGADWLVKGAVAIANKLKIPSIIVGLTIVAFGTSTPEFVVSIKAALNGVGGISVGNVVGSNIANILLILGVAGIISSVTCDKKTFLRDWGFMMFTTVLFVAFALSGKFVFWHGLVMLSILIGFIIFNYINSKNSDEDSSETQSSMADKNWLIVLGVTALGLMAILYGSDLLVKGAVDLAKIFGISEAIIGLTIVAVGTSMPELATTVVAAIRKQNGVALGNVVGSNIWNIVFIMGATSTIVDVEVVKQIMVYDIWVMVFATVVLLPIMLTQSKLNRIEGVLFLLLYAGYLISQVLLANGTLAL
ncbi:MAG: calcium/sodium antiporter [Alphaproteobacteria bacterium]|nr:calcium/sodium antiporter [Alphaproteobacteria bacterium]